jgi:hypothetical protein
MGLRMSSQDANTGQFAWRFYTIPGDPSKPFENPALKKAAETWSGQWWKLGGGGTVWDGMAYDPEADLIYVGTGNGGPWPEELRQSKGKDNLYVCSILAVKPARMQKGHITQENSLLALTSFRSGVQQRKRRLRRNSSDMVTGRMNRADASLDMVRSSMSKWWPD